MLILLPGFATLLLAVACFEVPRIRLHWSFLERSGEAQGISNSMHDEDIPKRKLGDCMVNQKYAGKSRESLRKKPGIWR